MEKRMKMNGGFYIVYMYMDVCTQKHTHTHITIPPIIINYIQETRRQRKRKGKIQETG